MKQWDDFFAQERKKAYYQVLLDRVAVLRKEAVVYPPAEQVFACFTACPLEQLKVVILGQDPYHQAGQAHGLSFSVPEGVKIPASLRNIYKELVDDLGGVYPTSGCLIPWAKAGVLLMNTTFTVTEGKPWSHRDIGWQIFTDNVLTYLNNLEQPLVFILWGAHAQKIAAHLDEQKHLVIRSAHPSPLAAYRGFFGSKPFSRSNAFLRSHGRSEVDWQAVEQ